MDNFGQNWLEMAKEVVEAANQGKTVSEFEIFQRLQPTQPGKGLWDRVRVFKYLEDSGSIFVEDGYLRVNRSHMPSWLELSLANGDDVGWEFLEQFDSTGELARKFDSSNLEAIGLSGELFVMAELLEQIPPELHTQIKQVSLKDDTLGFDIQAPRDSFGRMIKLEVKTTTRPAGSKFGFFLSRNEAQKSQEIEDWYLVAVQIHNGQPKLLGFAKPQQLTEYFPVDLSENSSWQSVKVYFDLTLFNQGLPLEF